MDDPDTAVGPIDKAYAQAEALLVDDDARAERRARVLAAIARSDPAPEVSAPKPMRRSTPPRGGWLIAASVIGAGIFMATQFPQRPPIASPTAAAAGATASATNAVVAPAPLNAAAPPPPPAPKALAAPRASADSIHAAANEAATVAAPQPDAFRAPSIAPLVERHNSFAADKAASADAAAPPPPPAPAMAGGLGVSSQGGFDRPYSQGESLRSRQIVRPSRTTPADSLGLAAAGGRTTEVADLLAMGVPVDAPDANGETALMKSIKAGRLKAVALLLRRGASLDQRNNAGLSARDMAEHINSEDLNRVIGETPRP